MTAGEAALANGKGEADPRDRRIAELKKQLGERDKVIGELTIANRINRAVSRGTRADGQSGFYCANKRVGRISSNNICPISILPRPKIPANTNLQTVNKRAIIISKPKST